MFNADDDNCGAVFRPLFRIEAIPWVSRCSVQTRALHSPKGFSRARLRVLRADGDDCDDDCDHVLVHDLHRNCKRPFQTMEAVGLRFHTGKREREKGQVRRKKADRRKAGRMQTRNCRRTHCPTNWTPCFSFGPSKKSSCPKILRAGGGGADDVETKRVELNDDAVFSYSRFLCFSLNLCLSL